MTQEQRLALRVLDMSLEQRMAWLKEGDNVETFLESVDDVMPELVEQGWARHEEFHDEPGAIVVTTGHGDVRQVVITDLGRVALTGMGSAVSGR